MIRLLLTSKHEMVEKVIPRFPRFTGGFKSFTIREFSNHEKGVQGRLLVYSQGSRDKVEKYLWLKFLWDELTQLEFRLLIATPSFLKSDLKVDFLKSLLIKPKKELRNRLLRIEKLFGLKQSSRERYLGFKSRLDVEIYEFQCSLPKPPKFSGYVKTPSSVGSKTPGGSNYLEPLTLPFEQFSDEIIDWYYLLTVGEIDLLSAKIIISPDES